MRRPLVATATAAVAIAFPAPLDAQAETATVVVVHGIPNTPVDVYVNGNVTLEDFAFETVTDPLSLPPGTHELAVRAAGADPSDPPLLSASADLAAGNNVSIIAHLSDDGDPTLTPFVNDTSPTAPGEGRIIVRHTAAAPAVDVLAGGNPVFTDLTNPNEAAADLPAGTVTATVALAGTTEPVIGPADMAIAAGMATIIYAVGSAPDGNLTVIVQTITELHLPATR
jgi:hypothetical protein